MTTLQKTETGSQTLLNLFTNLKLNMKAVKWLSCANTWGCTAQRRTTVMHMQMDCLTFKSDIAVVAEEFVVSDPDFSSRAGSTKVASTGNTLYHTWIISNSFQNTKKRKCCSKAAQIMLNKGWTITPQSLEAIVQRLVDQNATSPEEVF